METKNQYQNFCEINKIYPDSITVDDFIGNDFGIECVFCSCSIRSLLYCCEYLSEDNWDYRSNFIKGDVPSFIICPSCLDKFQNECPEYFAQD